MFLCCMKTIKDVFKDYRAALKDVYEAAEAEAISLLVISEITGLSKAAVKAFPEQAIDPGQAEKFIEILRRLETGEPVQYILGHTEFYGLPFKVTPAVLIPRPETEELVEWILSSVSSGQLAAGSEQLAVGSGQLAEKHILDIGTGSGCIPISLKKNLPGYKVSTIDISEDALRVAKENAIVNAVDVYFIQADILDLPASVTFPGLDIIVSNPPYVTPDDKTRMHKNVIDFEPHTALFVPKNDPLVFYKAIVDFAKKNLTKNGLLFFEINESFGSEVVELLTGRDFVNIELKKDMSGRDRMVKAVFTV